MDDQKIASVVDVGPPLPARTTHEQDLKTAGQRSSNRTWETTQAFLAISVTEVALLVVVLLVFKNDPNVLLAGLTMLSGLVNLVIGFYFGRTNHARIGDDPKQSPSMDDRR